MLVSPFLKLPQLNTAVTLEVLLARALKISAWERRLNHHWAAEQAWLEP